MAAEQIIQTKIQKWLRGQGYYVVNVMKAGRAGVPDLLCCINGTFVGLEVKAPNGRPTDLQRANINKINDEGGVAGIVRSVEDVDELLKDIL